ncbi:MAG TPA: hypothetical protein VIN58_02645 [Roseateles sp.]
MFAVAWLLPPAHAQTAPADRSGEQTLACLVRPATPLAYPEASLKLRVGGFYRLQMRFTDARKAADVEVLFEAGSEPLRQAVLEHVAQLRLPCLKPGEVVTAVQEFSFDALGVGRVKSPAPLNLPSPQPEAYAQCLRTSGRPPELTGGGGFTRIRQNLKNGNLIAELHFDGSDQPPRVNVLYDSLSSTDRNEILRYIAQYRLPCLPAGKHAAIEQQFSVRWSGNNSFAFNDLPIVKFLGLVKNLNERPVEFNLDSMACPFQVRWRLGRPAVRNDASEVGAPNANRLPLLAWLQEMELNLTKEQFEGLLGAELLINVPCGTIKLGDAAAG